MDLTVGGPYIYVYDVYNIKIIELCILLRFYNYLVGGRCSRAVIRGIMGCLYIELWIFLSFLYIYYNHV